jgi:hypothetical protein
MPIQIIVIGMGYMAQSIALAFLMTAYVQFIKERKFFFLILIVTGSLFHASLIIFAPMIFINFFHKNFLQKFILFAITIIIIFILLESYFNEMINNYILDDLSSPGAIYRLLLNFISVLIFLIFINKKKLCTNYKILFYFFSFNSLVLIILVNLSFATTAIDRIALYLNPIQILIINKFLITNFSANNRKIISTAFFIIYFVFMYTWFNFSNYSSDWIPYNNILF